MGLVSGKIALVTGAGAGIGRATALKFASEGASVMVSDIKADGGEETADMIRQTGGKAQFFKADISQSGDVAALIAKTVETYGRLDCACNNAGIEGKIAPLAEQSEDDFDAVIRVNLRGTFLCLKAEIVQMLEGAGGAIVNIASVAGLVGFTGLSPYVASKHAIAGLTKNAALEFSKSGVRVNAICPGGIDTRMLDSLADQISGGVTSSADMLSPMHPIGHIGTPDEIAELVVWLCSDRASFITGAIIPADGGYVAQ